MIREKFGSQLHCVHCGAPTLTILPCPNCPDVQFCSIECIKQGLRGPHRYECSMRLYGILRAVNRNVTGHGLSVGKLMALRLVTQRPPAFFMKNKAEFEELLMNCDKITSNNKFNQSTKGKLDGYHAILNLACTSINAAELEKKTKFALALFWLLESSNYFGVSDDSNLSDGSVKQLKLLIFNLLIKVKSIIQYLIR